MGRLVSTLGRVDVILHPRDWRFWVYPRGVGISLTGQYREDGRVVRQKIRIGPRMPIAPDRGKE